MLEKRTNPLSGEDIEKFFSDHLEYRLNMLLSYRFFLDGKVQFNKEMPQTISYATRVCAFEASRIVARVLLQFMGIGISNKGELREERKYYSLDGKITFEVKIPDLGGKWVELSDLTPREKEVIIEVIKTAHKSTAHFTHEDPNGGSPGVIREGSEIVIRLLRSHLYDSAGKESLFLKEYYRIINNGKQLE